MLRIDWLSRPLRPISAAVVVAGLTSMTLTGAQAQGQQPQVQQATDEADARMEVTAVSPPARVGAAIPNAASTFGDSFRDTVHKPWLVVVIQATLAERGCFKDRISGQWDDATQSAAASLLASGQGVTSASLVPSSGLLRALRSSPVRRCGEPVSGGQVASAVPGPVTSTSTVPGKAGLTSPLAKKSLSGQQASGAVAALPKTKAAKPRATSKSSKRSTSRSRSVTRSKKSYKKTNKNSYSKRKTASRRTYRRAGPAVFVRPTGVGRF